MALNRSTVKIQELCFELILDIDYEYTPMMQGSEIIPEEPPEVTIQKVLAEVPGHICQINIYPLLSCSQIDTLEAAILEEILE